MTDAQTAETAKAQATQKGSRIAALVSGAVRPSVDWLLAHWQVPITLMAFALAALYSVYIVASGQLFWDTKVYAAAVEAYHLIGTPYDWDYLSKNYTVPGPFIYPPTSLWFLDSLWPVLSHPAAIAVLIALHAAGFVLLPFLLMPPEVRKSRRDLLLICALYLVMFGMSGLKSFLSGNIAQAIMVLSLAGLVYSVRTRNYLPFYLALLLVSQVKIYVIVLAAVPFLVHRKFFVPLFVCFLALAGYGINYLAEPVILEGYKAAFEEMSTMKGVVGASVMSAVTIALQEIDFSDPGLIMPIALGVNFVYGLLIIAFGVAVLWSKAKPADPSLVFLWAFMGAWLSSPRLIEYDLAPLVIPFVVFLRAMIAARGPGLAIAVFAMVFGASLARTPLADWAAFVALVGVWLGMGVDWLKAAPLPAGNGAAPARPTGTRG